MRRAAAGAESSAPQVLRRDEGRGLPQGEGTRSSRERTGAVCLSPAQDQMCCSSRALALLISSARARARLLEDIIPGALSFYCVPVSWMFALAEAFFFSFMLV